MRKANIAELRNHLSRYLDHVRKGDIVRIFDRDEPIAEIVPLGARKKAKDEALEERLRRLEREGVIVRHGSGRISKKFFKLRMGKGSLVQALLEDREDRF